MSRFPPRFTAEHVKYHLAYWQPTNPTTKPKTEYNRCNLGDVYVCRCCLLMLPDLFLLGMIWHPFGCDSEKSNVVHIWFRSIICELCMRNGAFSESFPPQFLRWFEYIIQLTFFRCFVKYLPPPFPPTRVKLRISYHLVKVSSLLCDWIEIIEPIQANSLEILVLANVKLSNNAITVDFPVIEFLFDYIDIALVQC